MIQSDQFVHLGPENRHIIYSHMAKALNYPDQDLVTKLLDHSFVHPLLDILETMEKPDTKEYITQFQEVFNQTTNNPETLLLELEKDYTRMCFASKPRQVYLFESVHREGKLLQESTFEIARLYYEAGLKMDDSFDMPPDHIATEFEFMDYLCFKEIEGINTGDEEKKKYSQKLQNQVLEAHLGSFASKVGKALETHARTPFYTAIGRFIKDMV